MRTPLIGLTTYNTTNQGNHPVSALAHKYIFAILEAGGLPVLISSVYNKSQLVDLIKRLDGILFTGGGDIAVERYGGILHDKLTGIDEKRDSTEIYLVQEAIGIKKPFLGICRGFQLVNVALGGTLYEDIHDLYPNAIKHDFDSKTQRQVLAHPVTVEPGSQTAKYLGEVSIKVNSLHHQGIMKLASPLKATAKAPDGLVEALELPGYSFGIAVQWHPEWLLDQLSARNLFKAFIESSSG